MFKRTGDRLFCERSFFGNTTHAATVKVFVAGALTKKGVEQPVLEEVLGWRQRNRRVVTEQAATNTFKCGPPQIRLAVIAVATDVKTE
jgi:hypothetical protein